MSTVVDERIVSMQFDNRHFERNVSTTMSTLDKLKQKLNLSGASKGLEDVNAAARNVNLSPIGNAAETVGLKFNAMYTMADQAMRNITNSAMAAGKRIISALTIDPVKTGFKEYETQINAVQTILANTESKGTTIDQVNNALDELNRYADKTIYNFTEMTRNIGTFTAAGVDLDTSVNAIQGIANLAAVSGSTSQQASTAMYQLSQALSSGTVKLMDWNSVVNAGMGGQVFQDALKDTARVHGVAIDEMIESQGSFRETLSKGWLTSEILTETLMKFTMATEGLTETEIEANREKLRGLGYTEEQIEAIFKLGNTATNAATKVKTLTQLWDVMKEAAQSGWAQTWKLIVGDFEEAKALFTPLADFFTGVINNISEARNKLLETTFAKNFKGLGIALKEIYKTVTEPIEAVGEAISGVTRSLEEHEAVVDEVIVGKWGHMQERWDALTAAGYDWMWVQNKVNEKMGSAVRRQTDYNGAVKEQVEAQEEIVLTQAQRIAQLAEEEDANLRAMNLTNEQIEALRDLKKIADQLGMSVEDVVENIDNIDGRWIFINSFRNIGKGILDVFNAIKTAWQEIFPPKSVEEKADALFNLLGAFHKFTMVFRGLTNEEGEFTETGEKLVRTLKGIFAIVDIVTTILGGGLKIAFKAVSALLKYFNLDILDVTAYVGDALVAFRDWMDSLLDFEGLFERIGPTIESIVVWIKRGFNAIPDDMISGFINGIWDGIKRIGSVLMTFANTIITTVCDVLGIHSPSRVFMAIGGFVIAGLLAGLSIAFPEVKTFLTGVCDTIVGAFKSIDLGQAIALAIGGGLLFAVTKITNVISLFAAPLDGLGEMFEGVGSMFTDIGKGFKSKQRSKALLNMAIAIVALAGALVMISNIPADRLWTSVGAMFALVGVVTLLGLVAVGLGKVSDLLGGSGFGVKEVLTLLGISAALLLVALATGQLAKVASSDLGGALKTLTVLAIGLSVLVVGIAAIMRANASIEHVGGMLLKLAIAMLLMIGVVKLASGITESEIERGLTIVGALAILFGALILVSKSTGEFTSKAGSMLVKMSIAFLLMISIVKIASGLDTSEVTQGLSVVIKLGLLFAALIAVSKLAGENANKAGSMILSMSTALLFAIGAMKLAAGMEPSELKNGLIAVTTLGLIFAALVAVSKRSGKNMAKVGSMLILMSGALVIMTGVAFLLSQFETKDLVQGLVAIGVMSVIFERLISVTKHAKSGKGMVGVLVTLIVAITLLVGAVVALTFIEPSKLAAAIAALAGIVAVFSGLMYATKFLQSGEKTWKRNLTTLALLGGIIAIMGGIVIVLSDVDDPNRVVSVAVGMSSMLLALGVSMRLISNTKTFTKGQLKSIITSLLSLTVAMGLMGGLIYLMQWLPDSTSGLQNAIGMSLMLTAMSIALTAVTKIKGDPVTILKNIGLLAAMVVPLVIFAHAINNLPNVIGQVPNILGITAVLLAMTGLLTILTLVSKLGGKGLNSIIGIGLLTAMIIPLIAFVHVLNNLEIPDLTGQVDQLLVLGAILTAMTLLMIPLALIGGMGTAALIGMGSLAAFIVGFGVIVGAIGYLMTEFENLETFVDKGIPILEKLATGLGSVLGKMVNSFASGLFDGMFSSLGEELSEFMDSAKSFFDGMTNVDPNIGETVKSLASAMLALTASDVLDGLTSWFTGGTSMAAFGEDLAAFGPHLRAFADSVSGLTPDALNAMKISAEAGKTLADMASSFPNSGGWLGKILGENDADTFGSQLAGFGKSLMSYGLAVNGIGAYTESIEMSVTAGNSLSDLANAIPNSGGWAATILGDNDMDTWGTQLTLFGTHLMNYGRHVSNIAQYVQPIDDSVSAAKSLSDLSKAVPNSGGWAATILGDNDMGTWGSNLALFGTYLMDYARSVSSIATYTAAISASVNAAKDLAKVSDVAKSVNKWDWGKSEIVKFGETMSAFGNEMKTYASNIAGINTNKLSSVTTQFVKLADLAKGIKESDFGGMSAFATSLNKLGNSGVDKFIAAFTNAHTKADVAGREFVKSLVKGAEDAGENSLNVATKKMANTAADKAKEAYISFYNAGSYLVTGFANGISDNAYRAAAKAASMAKSALQSVQEVLLINSPSKAAYEMGNYFGIGFVNGVGDNVGSAYDISSNMATEARKGLSEAISKVHDFINGDFETAPVIRPVLDLTNVQAGANAIGSMLGTDKTVGVLSNINANVDSNRQNGGNDEVVASINKLRREIATMPRNTYSINGVTYDDGSNVRGAIEEIARYALRERRV